MSMSFSMGGSYYMSPKDMIIGTPMNITIKEPKQCFYGHIADHIEDVEFYPPAVKMTFKDGTVITHSACGDDEYDPEIGMAMCVLDYIWGGKQYNNCFRKWIKKDADVKKHKEKIEALKAERKAIEARQKEKNAKRKAAKAERARQAEIEIQKEAYIQAMRELNASANEV